MNDREQLREFVVEHMDFFDEIRAAAERGARKAGWTFGHKSIGGQEELSAGEDLLLRIAMEVAVTIARGLKEAERA